MAKTKEQSVILSFIQLYRLVRLQWRAKIWVKSIVIFFNNKLTKLGYKRVRNENVKHNVKFSDSRLVRLG